MQYQKKPVNIDGYEEYQCDTEGIVYGKNGKPLKPNINSHGYKYVVFCVNGKCKTFMVHRIIALTFVLNPNSEKFNVVNHLDGNKLNNNADNFEWTDFSGNLKHSIEKLGNDFSGGNSPQAKPIAGYDKKSGELKYQFTSLSDAAKYFTKEGKNYRRIVSVIWRSMQEYKSRKSYRGCIWKYIED